MPHYCILIILSDLYQEVKREVSTTENNRNLYDNPPPLTQTLFGSNDKKPDSEGSSSSFNQAALTIGSLLLIGVFVVVSGGSDLANIAAPQRTAPQVTLQCQYMLQLLSQTASVLHHTLTHTSVAWIHAIVECRFVCLALYGSDQVPWLCCVGSGDEC